MKFKDDIVVTVTLGEGGGGARVDARSRSRLGQGDMGANGARLVAYFNRLAAALAAAGLGPVSKL